MCLAGTWLAHNYRLLSRHLGAFNVSRPFTRACWCPGVIILLSQHGVVTAGSRDVSHALLSAAAEACVHVVSTCKW